jgi:glycosyltransferase involved in cell wall biosynthesis
MSILIVVPRYAPDVGGIETLLSQIVPGLAARGLDLVVVAGTDGGLPESSVIDGIPVYRIPFALATVSAKPGEMLEAMRRLRQIEDDHDVTIRHIQGFGDIGLWFAMRAHSQRPLPLAVTVHGTFEYLGALGPSALELLRRADIVTAVSEAVRSAVVAELRDDSADVRLLPNGLRFDDAPATAWPEHGHLLCVGRLLEQKGFDVAIEALAHLTPTHPSLELVIAGGTAEEQVVLRRHAERWEVADRVRMVPRVPYSEVRRLMDDASMVLVPSRHTEGFSLAALEAAHAGRPVIASRVGGLVDTVEEGVTGVLVPPDRPIALAHAISTLLSDPATTALMGKRGRERADEHFSLDVCVDGYQRLYQDLAALAPSTRASA